MVPQLFNVALLLERCWQLDRLRSLLPVTPGMAVPAILGKINKRVPASQEPRSPTVETKRDVTLSSRLCVLLLFSVQTCYQRRNGNPRVSLKQSQRPFGSKFPTWAGENVRHLESSPGTPQSRPAWRHPSFLPFFCLPSPLGHFHDSLFPCIKGMTYTEMSSPEPSRSFDIRHPRSFRTPRARITRS